MILLTIIASSFYQDIYPHMLHNLVGVTE